MATVIRMDPVIAIMCSGYSTCGKRRMWRSVARAKRLRKASRMAPIYRDNSYTIERLFFRVCHLAWSSARLSFAKL